MTSQYRYGLTVSRLNSHYEEYKKFIALITKVIRFHCNISLRLSVEMSFGNRLAAPMYLYMLLAIKNRKNPRLIATTMSIENTHRQSMWANETHRVHKYQ